MPKQISLYSAPWCTPCKIVKEWCKDQPVTVYDIEEDIDRTEKYNIRSVPTLIVEEDGIEVKRSTGNFSGDKNKFLEFIK